MGATELPVYHVKSLLWIINTQHRKMSFYDFKLNVLRSGKWQHDEEGITRIHTRFRYSGAGRYHYMYVSAIRSIRHWYRTSRRDDPTYSKTASEAKMKTPSKKRLCIIKRFFHFGTWTVQNLRQDVIVRKWRDIECFFVDGHHWKIKLSFDQ